MTSDEALVTLLQGCTLVDVVCRDMSARLHIEGEPGPEGLEEGVASTDLSMGFDVAPEKVDFAFTARVSSSDLEASAEVVARYEFAQKTEDLAEETVAEFAQRVAFMAAYPFLREVIRTLTARLPVPSAIVLPIVQGPPAFRRIED